MLISPTQYFVFPETNGWKLETLDAIFAEAYEKKENPVFTEKRHRKQKTTPDMERPAEGSGSDAGSQGMVAEVKGDETETEKRETV